MRPHKPYAPFESTYFEETSIWCKYGGPRKDRIRQSKTTAKETQKKKEVSTPKLELMGGI